MVASRSKCQFTERETKQLHQEEVVWFLFFFSRQMLRLSRKNKANDLVSFLVTNNRKETGDFFLTLEIIIFESAFEFKNGFQFTSLV